MVFLFMKIMIVLKKENKQIKIHKKNCLINLFEYKVIKINYIDAI